MSDLTWGDGVQSREEQRQLKRMAILRTAAGMINESGFRKMSLEKLAASLNITKPTLYYYIKDEQDDPLVIDILDASGAVVRSYGSEETDFERCRVRNADARRVPEFKYPTVEQGLNKWTWDLRRENMPCLDKVPLFAGGFGGTRVTPGQYTARVTVGATSRQASFSVLADPRVQATPEQVAALEARVQEVNALLRHVLDTLEEARRSRAQVQAMMAEHPEGEQLQTAGKRASKGQV